MTSSEGGRIAALHVNVAHRAPLQRVEHAEFVAARGIEGDRHFSEREERRGFQVLMIEQETLQALDLAPGAVRESVTTTGLALASLDAGRRLAVGSEVVVEISAPAAPCSRMDEVRPGLKAELEGRRGMLASVVSGGAVRVGDRVSVLAADDRVVAEAPAVTE